MSLAPHPFSLRQLQYVVAVADSLSFRRAAERCHVSQPALSAQLSQLEEVLGVRLFERDRRRVIATAAGRELVARARFVLRAADDLVEAARNAGDPLSGTFRVGIIPTISPYLLPCIAPALREKYPRLILLWVEDKTEVLVRTLEEGGLDAAVLALEAEVGDVEWEALAKDPFVLATPTGDPLGKKQTPATLAELRGARVLLLDDGHCFREQALTFCTSANTEELEFRATSLSTLAQMVAGGAGVTLLPELAVPTEVRRAGLHTRPLAAPVPHRTVVLAWRRNSPLAGPLRSVAATLRDAYPRGGAAVSGRKGPSSGAKQGSRAKGPRAKSGSVRATRSSSGA
jgi:LysR family transcriptional regulator, hydrogen peroxide-inducible genes activator